MNMCTFHVHMKFCCRDHVVYVLARTLILCEHEPLPLACLPLSLLYLHHYAANMKVQLERNVVPCIVHQFLKN